MVGQAGLGRFASTIGLLAAALIVVLGSTPPARAEADHTSHDVDGESLFDQLFGRRDDDAIGYDIPYPFTALTRRIAMHLARPDGGPSPLVQVLIPLGRSLQRDAAEPEFFMSPRVIVAVDGEPAASSSPLLRDRLFLGYQAKANAIEVISYNEGAGRFEFQVVQDYGPGLSPTVSSPSRSVCITCHQNGGPIWSAAPWDETNANPEVASLLLEQGLAFQGVPARLAAQGAETAFRMAASIERANRLPAQQHLWQQACGHSARCRGNLFTAMLQHRLSGKRGHDQATVRFEAGWAARWPHGLPLHDPRIPNRDPFDRTTGITGALDPLEPRPSRTFLEASDEDALEQVIAGLAGFLPAPDIRALDAYLSRIGEAARGVLEAPCSFSGQDLGGWALQMRFGCGDPEGAGLSLAGQVYIEPGKATRGTIERLRLGGTERPVKLRISGPEIPNAEHGGEAQLSLAQPIGGLQARLTDGRLLARLTLRWDTLAAEETDPSAELRRHADNGGAGLLIVDDFAHLRGPLEALIRESEVLGSETLQGGPMMQDLFQQMRQNYGSPSPISSRRRAM